MEHHKSKVDMEMINKIVTIKLTMKVYNKTTDTDIRVKVGTMLGHEISGRYSEFLNYEIMEIKDAE